MKKEDILGPYVQINVFCFSTCTVSFLKRAQIFVGDLWSRFAGRGFGKFDDIHTLTMFADYRSVMVTFIYTLT